MDMPKIPLYVVMNSNIYKGIECNSTVFALLYAALHILCVVCKQILKVDTTESIEPYWLYLNPTLEYNSTQCTIVHFTIFWVLKYSKFGHILVKTLLNLN